jgi:MoxR-like ATPase
MSGSPVDSDASAPLSSDVVTRLARQDWPFSKAEEIEWILARYYRREAYDELGAALGVGWFETDGNDARSDEEAARTALTEYIATHDNLDRLFEVAEPDTTGFGEFFGFHYTLSAKDDDLVVRDGPSIDQWEAIVTEVRQLSGDNEKMRAFLRGIVENDRTFHGRILTDFSDANARGSAHYDGNLWMSNGAELPGQITGISTRKGSSSGRTYTVAVELVPVITATLNELDERANGPISTPDRTVPDELDRRIPKFQEVLEEVSVTGDDINRFEAILDDHDALDYWADYVAPTVKFRDRAKQAILCVLASPEDAHDTKGRTNAILFGPPGTGKSAFKNFLVEEFGAFSIDGARVSRADLTYNKNSDEDGLLVRAHKGLAVIEEADELDDNALGAALTAFGEAGRIEIRDMQLPAQVRGILLGNYRSREEIIAAHSEAVFDRFEFVLRFDRLTDSERDAAIDWQYDHFRQPKAPEETRDLKKFVAWVRAFDPAIPERELQKIKRFKQERIETVENVREGVSIMTVAYTIARLNHRDLTLEDYETAFELVA